MLVSLKHPQSDLVKQCKLGFSWTTLLFGPFPALGRGDLKWFLLNLGLGVVTFGVSNLVLSFTYNKTYVKSLLDSGYLPADELARSALQASGFVVPEQATTTAANPDAALKPPMRTGTKGAIAIAALLAVTAVEILLTWKSAMSTYGRLYSSAAAAAVSKAEMPSSNIGDVVEVANFVYRVEEIEFRESIGKDLTGKSADGVFLLVKLSIENIGAGKRTLDQSRFKLIDASGAEFKPSAEGAAALEKSGVASLFMKSCSPNAPRAGYLVFEVPSEQVFYLMINGGLWAGRTGNIRLVKADG